VHSAHDHESGTGAYSSLREDLLRVYDHRPSVGVDEQGRSSHLKALGALLDVISGAGEGGVDLQLLAEHIPALLEVDAAAILAMSGDGRGLEYRAFAGITEQAAKELSLSSCEAWTWKALQERRMVRIDGLELSRLRTGRLGDLIRKERFTSCVAAPLSVNGTSLGALELYGRTEIPSGLQWQNLLDILSKELAIAIQNHQLVLRLRKTESELEEAYDATLEGWMRALDIRDGETEGHTRRVTEMTVRLARKLNVPDDQLVHIRRGAMLHDIGKLAVPMSILRKPGPLTRAEWAVMRQHPNYAYTLLSPIRYLRPALDIPYCHHERWDGSGYPRGLKGEQIPLAARIFAVVDVWDALRNDRPYRKAWDERHVHDYIAESTGRQFDPEIVEAFFELI